MTIPASHQDDAYQCGVHQIAGTVSDPGPREVLIVGKLAARYSDQCKCTPEHKPAHKSVIAEGAAKLLIEGLPAARLLVKTVDGGAITSGEASVLVGGETFSLPSCISIEGNVEFQVKVLKDLYKISGTKSGQRLFADMQASGKKCTICPGPGPHTNSGSVTHTDPILDNPRNSPSGKTWTDPRSTNGTGIDVKIYYNPQNDDSTLFHEGMHANDMMHGITNENPCPNPGAQKVHGDLDPIAACERKATGLPPYDKQPYSQNTYNKERGYPPFWYKGFAGNVPAKKKTP